MNSRRLLSLFHPILLVSTLFLMAACGKTSIRIGIETVCEDSDGAAVELTGYVFLPTFRETVQMSREGEIVAIGHIVVLTERADGSGAKALLSLRETSSFEPNRIRHDLALARERTLSIVGKDGRQITEGSFVTVTGVTVPDDSAACLVDTRSIETK